MTTRQVVQLIQQKHRLHVGLAIHKIGNGVALSIIYFIVILTVTTNNTKLLLLCKFTDNQNIQNNIATVINLLDLLNHKCLCFYIKLYFLESIRTYYACRVIPAKQINSKADVPKHFFSL